MSGDAPEAPGLFDARTDSEALAIALRMGADLLSRAPSGNDPMREAKLLLGKAAALEPSQLPRLGRADFTEVLVLRYMALIDRRIAREPMSHILGYRDFWTHRFKVTRDVLDPRPDTETLVAEALKAPFDSVLDLGTGSGCILISLLAERPKARGQGVDLSDAALAVARENAATLGVEARAQLTQGSWFEPVKGAFDLIVSNPPYIAQAEMNTLQAELAREPRMALTDEADGLSAYRDITAGAPAHLSPGGRLMVEIGHAQGEAVAALFTGAGLNDVTVIQDLNGKDRVVSGRM